MKDELKSCIIKEGVWLKSKSYALKIQGKYDKKTKVFHRNEIVEKVAGKGIKECVRDANLSYEKHFECLNKAFLKSVVDSNRKTIVKQNIIRSHEHKLQTISMSKVALSAFDIKRKIDRNNITTRPFGYVDVNDLFNNVNDKSKQFFLTAEEVDVFLQN